MKHKRNTDRPARLGAMAPLRNRTSDEPSYQQILTKHRLLLRGANIADAWQLWQKVCEDPKVRTMAQVIERPKHRTMASITAGYRHLGKVLDILSAR